MQMKAEGVYFSPKKFFTPLKSILPPFYLKFHKIRKNENFSDSKKGGKKLLRGVKNFVGEKYTPSAFICIKNHQ